MSARNSRIARKYVNVVDQVRPAPHAPVPAFTVIARVDKPNVENVSTQEPYVDFVREKQRTTGAFWAEFNDLTLADLVGR